MSSTSKSETARGGVSVTYPDDDLAAGFVEGKWRMLHKDGTPY